MAEKEGNILEKPKVTPESLNDRYQRYLNYFTINIDSVVRMHHACIRELEKALLLHLESSTRWQPEKCSLMCLDTCINMLPTGNEKGIYYAVDFGGTNLRVIRMELFGNGKSERAQIRTNIRTRSIEAKKFKKGLLDQQATATMLFDTISLEIKKLMEKKGDLERDEASPLGFAFSFAIEQKKLNSAILKNWTKGFETGSATKDPVVGKDVCTLLNVACTRNKVPALVVASLNDTTGTLLSAAYERERGNPPCLLGVILGTGMNACYFQPNAEEYGYQGTLINTELGGFDKELPWNIIDIEVDFASPNRGRQRLEKMVAGMYIPELCRRVVIKVFQIEAPLDAWAHDSITGEACSAIMNDDTPDLSITQKVLNVMWNWNPPADYIKMVKCLFHQIFERSAALAAAAIAAMAVQTGYLQPAMGGLTVGVDGSLYVQNKMYRDMLQSRLVQILGEDTAELITFKTADDGSGKGAAILAACAQTRQETVMKSSFRTMRQV